MPESPYPDWLEFHSFRFGGPVAGVRSRSGVVRVEVGEGESVDRVLVGIPDDDAWRELTETLTETGFWEWPVRTSHREPHERATGAGGSRFESTPDRVDSTEPQAGTRRPRRSTRCEGRCSSLSSR